MSIINAWMWTHWQFVMLLVIIFTLPQMEHCLHCIVRENKGMICYIPKRRNVYVYHAFRVTIGKIIVWILPSSLSTVYHWWKVRSEEKVNWVCSIMLTYLFLSNCDHWCVMTSVRKMSDELEAGFVIVCLCFWLRTKRLKENLCLSHTRISL